MYTVMFLEKKKDAYASYLPANLRDPWPSSLLVLLVSINHPS